MDTVRKNNENSPTKTEPNQDTRATDLLAEFESFKASFKSDLARNKAMDQFTPNMDIQTTQKKGFLSSIKTGIKKFFGRN